MQRVGVINAVLVCQILGDTTTPRDIRLLNPCSPTDRHRQPVCTMTAIADAGELRDVTLVPVQR